jgi:hypothetical protein
VVEGDGAWRGERVEQKGGREAMTTEATIEKVVTILHREGWTVRLAALPHWCDWELFQTISDVDPGPDESREYWGADRRTIVTNVDAAEREVSGFVKWDGCNEMHVDGAHQCGPFCARDLLTAIAWAMSEAWRAIARCDDGYLDFGRDTILPDGKDAR